MAGDQGGADKDGGNGKWQLSAVGQTNLPFMDLSYRRPWPDTKKKHGSSVNNWRKHNIREQSHSAGRKVRKQGDRKVSRIQRSMISLNVNKICALHRPIYSKVLAVTLLLVRQMKDKSILHGNATWVLRPSSLEIIDSIGIEHPCSNAIYQRLCNSKSYQLVCFSCPIPKAKSCLP